MAKIKFKNRFKKKTNILNSILTSIFIVALGAKRFQPNIGITQRSDKPQAKPINNKARARVRLPRY